MKDFKINIYKNIPILVLAMSLLIISSAQAGFNPIKCETNFGEKTFIIEESNTLKAIKKLHTVFDLD